MMSSSVRSASYPPAEKQTIVSRGRCAAHVVCSTCDGTCDCDPDFFGPEFDADTERELWRVGLSWPPLREEADLASAPTSSYSLQSFKEYGEFYDPTGVHYGRALFAPDDFARLADQLAGIQGRFVMSINDVPEIRALFAAFDLQPVETTYGISRQAAAKAAPRAELLISNAAARA